MKSEFAGQTWAAATEGNWYLRGGRYEKRIVYCHTSQMTPSTEGQPFNRCDKFGGKASWSRCRKCKKNWGFASMWRFTYPKVELVMCATKTKRYAIDDARCQRCSQVQPCIRLNVKKAKRRIRLRVL